MPERKDWPVAVRATAFIRPSRWLHRPLRLVRYDAYWANGRVDFNVRLSQVMYRGHPADFAAIDESVHTHCPEVGTGQWVDQFGRAVEGPAEPDPKSAAGAGGVRRKYGVSRYQTNKKLDAAWRLGGGGAGTGLGTLLLTGPMSDGPVGFVGVLCLLGGLSALAGFIPKKYQPW
jgi:hypothetical protein